MLRSVRARPGLFDSVALLLFALASIGYFWSAIALAGRAPFWMDEILALWTARRPDLPSLWAALKGGSEFTPPLYDSLLHLMMKAGLSTPLLLRLPSILAGYGAAMAMVVLVRRFARWPFAALAGAMLLVGLFDYAVQARPYIFVTAAFGWALVLWDGLPERPSRGGLLALLMLLAGMVALHFYAILLVGLVALLEIARRAGEGRGPRPGVLAAVGIAGASILLWWPIMQAASTFSGQDVGAPGYYGRPSLLRLIPAYASLAGWFGLIALGLAAFVVGKRRGRLTDSRYGVTALLLCALPLLVMLFAMVVSHSFAPRYAIAGIFGFALLLAWTLHQFDSGAVALTMLLLLALGIGREPGEIAKTDRLETLRVIAAAPGDLPIATGSGLRFIEAMENMPPVAARRIRYLDLPGISSWDPTNRHQVERWKAIDPSLPVVDAGRFLCATPRFLLLVDPSGGGDDVRGWLESRARFPAPPRDRPALIPVESLPCRSGAGGSGIIPPSRRGPSGPSR